MIRRRLALGGLAVGLIGLLASGMPAEAQEHTFRIHQMLPPQATIPAKFIEPWAKRVEEQSGGRLAFELYPSMQLGGKPPGLYDQVRDGVIDITWTLPGYTPGRFPKVEAFELPFMVTTAAATSQAFQEFYEQHIADQFPDVHVIAVHTHGPGLLHMKGDPIETLEDLQGKKLRGPTRVINGMLEKLGAVPVGMPVPAVPESLSKGVIDGTVIPWEVTAPLKVAELVDSHTGFTGDRGFYTATFVFAMNKAKYESLPDDLKKVIDDNSGVAAAKLLGEAMDGGDAIGLKIAEERGNPIIMLDEAETQRWREAAQPVIDEWIAEMDAAGVDGAALVEEARALVEKYSAE
jgi:TRAP-type C4-dicarboxylate transport system substrate-binding protein